MATHVPKMSRYGLEVAQGKQADDLGFVNMLTELDTPTGVRPAYLSVSILRQWAARIPQLGLVDASKVQEVYVERDRLRAELDQVLARAAEAEGKIKSYEDGFKQVIGRTPPKRQGRPPKEKVVG